MGGGAHKWRRYLPAVAVLAALGVFLWLRAADPKLTPVQSNLLNPNGNLTLFVSNQSFDITPVDIRVEIDGEVVVHEYFEVGNQHNWKTFRLKLSPGQHDLSVRSRKGRAWLSRTFTIQRRHWAVIDYWHDSDRRWYVPWSASDGPSRSFSFGIRSKPIEFD